ncbi:MAG: apolipoprotein N-acyltransferase [Proteobacteria bacterium]|nr:apolipoprotein N-acyltransferase [Pseudomonadota bacterium]
MLHAVSQTLEHTGAFVRALTGWRRFLFALITGLLSALAFAPFNLFPFLLIAFAALVLLIDGAQSPARPFYSAALAALAGWGFGFGHFLAGFYWIGYAFVVDAADHAWQLPFVALIFPGSLALFTALACGLASLFWLSGIARIFIFAVAYVLLEWLRGHIFTGFPWNIPAYSWGGSLAILQSVSLIGAYGLSLLTILLGASLAIFFGEERPRAWLAPASMIALFVLLWCGGAARLALTPTEDVTGVNLRIVQPDVPQQEKYTPELRVRNWRRLVLQSVEKSGQKNSEAPTHIIWPEAAPPFLLSREPEALDDVAILTSGNRVLMTGAVRADVEPDQPPRYYNSFYIFGHGGQLLATYDKFHLVPFGEYLPFESLMNALGLKKIVGLPGSFSFGPGPQTYSVPGAPDAGPLICYEILFPAAVTGAQRPQWFVNVTDDSWFGPPSSSGPQQHFLIARVRAIEEGIPVARAANTGISAVIDPLGRVVAELGAGQMGIIDAKLPVALPPTLYARLGDFAFLLLILSCIALAFWMGRQEREAFN